MIDLNVSLCSGEKTKIIKAQVTELSENEYSVKVPASAVGKGYECVEIFNDIFSASDTDNGFFIVPTTFGSRLVRFKKTSGDGELIPGHLSLRIVAFTLNGTSYVGKVVGMSEEYKMVCGKKNNKYYYFLRFPLEGRAPYEDIEIILYKTDNKDFDYSAMAKWYREKSIERGDIIPLSVKIKTRPYVKYANESVNIRIRMAWKPVPSPVKEQTRETEPPLHIACTFKMVEDLIDELKANGVDKADICLVGWNISGHDGRWPEMFPVEPKLGGEKGLLELIEKADKAGYILNLHTNATDAYTIAENFNEDYIIKNADGSLRKAGTWSGGDMYAVSLPYRKDAYISDLKKLSALGIKGMHYCDVITCLSARRSYSEKFPMTPKQYRETADELFKAMQDIFGGSSSEGGIDVFSKYLDYVLYSEFTGTWKIDPDNDPHKEWMDELIPLWAMINHGSIIFNVESKTINYVIKDFGFKLKVLEQGARPVAYCFVDFIDNNSPWGSEDLTWKPGERPDRVAKSIAKMYNTYKEYESIWYSFIDKHEKLSDGVFKTTYDNGVSIVVDYNKNEHKINEAN